MRPLDDLQAAVGARGAIEGDHATGQERRQTSVVIPVPVILMPGPGPAERLPVRRDGQGLRRWPTPPRQQRNIAPPGNDPARRSLHLARCREGRRRGVMHFGRRGANGPSGADLTFATHPAAASGSECQIQKLH